MSNVNKITALLMSVYLKMKGDTKGKFVMKNFSFKEKGNSFEIKNLEVSWSYQDTDFCYSDNEFTFTGKPDIQILIENLLIISPEDEGKFSIDYISLNGAEEIESFKLLLPKGLFK